MMLLDRVVTVDRLTGAGVDVIIYSFKLVFGDWRRRLKEEQERDREQDLDYRKALNEIEREIEGA